MTWAGGLSVGWLSRKVADKGLARYDSWQTKTLGTPTSRDRLHGPGVFGRACLCLVRTTGSSGLASTTPERLVHACTGRPDSVGPLWGMPDHRVLPVTSAVSRAVCSALGKLHPKSEPWLTTLTTGPMFAWCDRFRPFNSHSQL